MASISAKEQEDKSAKFFERRDAGNRAFAGTDDQGCGTAADANGSRQDRARDALGFTDRGIALILLHPGYVATAMVGGGGDISPDAAGAQLAKRLDELTLAQTGSFHHAKGDALPW